MSCFKIKFIVLIFFIILVWQLPARDNDLVTIYNQRIASGTSDTLKINGLKVDQWFSYDKGLHLVGSMISTVALSKSLQKYSHVKKNEATYIAMGFTLSLGVSKELWDWKKPKNMFSFKDLTADFLGLLMGGVLVNIK